MNMKKELNFVGVFPTERRAASEPGCSEKSARVASNCPNMFIKHFDSSATNSYHIVQILISYLWISIVNVKHFDSSASNFSHLGTNSYFPSVDINCESNP